MSASIEDAVALHRAGRLAEAERAYRDVLRARPSDPDALHLLGALLHQQGDHDRSAELIGRAIAINPASPVFHYNLGNAERARGRPDAALAAYRRELELNPGFDKARGNLAALAINHGGELLTQGELARAETLLRESLALAETAEGLTTLALLLSGLDRFDEAFALYERALARDPARLATWRNILPAILYHPGFDNAARFAWHERFARAARSAAGPLPAPSFDLAGAADRRLRIGWLSSDFRAHPVARNLEPVLAHRDRDRFAAFLYGDVVHPDSVTSQLREISDSWRQINGMSETDVAAAIRADEVDILVILGGHFDDNRPTIAVHRAAPIQVAFHDAATSGLPEIDYLIADPVLAPRATRERFAERVLRLPSFYVHAPLTAPDAPRSDARPTFGCFGNPSKINGATIALWARILVAAPEWTLLLRYRDRYASAEIRARFTSAFAAHGVASERIRFATRAQSEADHFGAYAEIDIALDTFPFNGSTTTFEALAMGAPVVALRGDAMAGRWSASILTALGRAEWIAATPDDYVAIASRLARARTALAWEREKLRESVRNSPLCDGASRARQIERLLSAVWRRRVARGA